MKSEFLNTPPARDEYARGDVRSFSQVRKALQYLSCKLVAQEDKVMLSYQDCVVLACKWKVLPKVLRTIGGWNARTREDPFT